MLEFIDVFKGDMTPEQLCKAVSLVCKNIHHFNSVQGQSLNVIKSLLDSIRNLKDKGTRNPITNSVDTMYTMILTTLSKRLSYFKMTMEEIIEKSRESKVINQRNTFNINEHFSHFKRTSDITKAVINEKYYASTQPMSIVWDQYTVKLITKIIKNMILAARVYLEYKLEREEKSIYDNITLILFTISGCQPSQNIFHDIFQTLLPFLFLSLQGF